MGLYSFYRISKPSASQVEPDKVEDRYRSLRNRTFWGVTAAYSLYYVCRMSLNVVKQPLNLLECAEKYDIKVNLDGGGFTGQSQALRLAIARALVKVNEEDKKALKDQGFLTRDSREVERKKPGRPKARRRFQFSKR